MYVALGRYEEGIAALQRSIALRSSTDAYNNLGYAYTLMHRFPDAVEALQQALRIDDRDWMNWGNLGDALYWSPGRRAEAAAKYRKARTIAASALEVNPKEGLTWSYLAGFSAMLEDRQEALAALDKALALAPTNGEVLFRAAIVYNHFGQTDETLLYLRRAVHMPVIPVRLSATLQILTLSSRIRNSVHYSSPRAL